MKIAHLIAAAALMMAAGSASAQITLESAPPIVVSTSPAAGADGVDPSTTEIRVTFSKPMRDGTWSWTTGGLNNFPEVNGKIRYLDDHRTCVLPVKLQPGKVYAAWANGGKHMNFKDTAGRAAVPYMLVFKTKE